MPSACELFIFTLTAKRDDFMKKKSDFIGWDDWKKLNHKGFESEVTLVRKGGHIVLKTENFGIEIENITDITEVPDKIYVALTGDQVALTDIRID